MTQAVLKLHDKAGKQGKQIARPIKVSKLQLLVDLKCTGFFM